MCRAFADPWPCSEGTDWSCTSPGLTVRGRRAKALRCRLLPTSRRAVVPRLLCPMTCLPWTQEGAVSAGLPSFPCGHCHKRATQSKGGRRVGGPAVLSPGVEGLHRLPLPASSSPQTCLDPRESRAPPASTPHHFPFFLAGTFGRNELWRGGNHPLHWLPEHSHGQGVSKRGRQGEGR